MEAEAAGRRDGSGGGYGFGDELCGEEGGEFDDAPEGDDGTVEPQRVERGWVELGGEMVG